MYWGTSHLNTVLASLFRFLSLFCNTAISLSILAIVSLAVEAASLELNVLFTLLNISAELVDELELVIAKSDISLVIALPLLNVG